VKRDTIVVDAQIPSGIASIFEINKAVSLLVPPIIAIAFLIDIGCYDGYRRPMVRFGEQGGARE
jgi:hypothetical protein